MFFFSIFDSVNFINFLLSSNDNTPRLTEPFSVNVLLTKYPTLAYLFLELLSNLDKYEAAVKKASLP